MLTLLAVITLSAPIAGNAASDAPRVSITNKENIWTVDADFELSDGVTPEIAWQVLTNYDHLSEFVPSMKVSRIVSQSGGALVVDQMGAAKALFLSENFHVRLAIHEYGERAITFRDTAHDDFLRYEGSWTMRKDPNGHWRLDYHVIAEPKLDLPEFIFGPAFKENTRLVLGQIRAEMLKKANNL